MIKKMISGVVAVIMLAAMTACTPQNNTNTSSPSDSANASSQPSASVPGASATQGENTQPSSQPVDSLVIAVTKDENSLTPFTYVSITGLVVNRLIYDTLFTTDLENNVVPWMVQDDYKVSEDFKSYTLTLIEGQKFHDGTPVTTADVKFSFEYPNTQNVSGQRKICSEVESIDIVDERTLTINLKNSDMNFMRGGLAYIRIISKAQYENIQDGTTITATMGSGMYKLEEYKVGQYYVLKAVDGYFKGTPKVTTLNMPIMADNTAVQSALLSGEIAASTSSITIEMLDTFKSAQNIEVFANAGYAPMLLNLNNGAEPMNDPAFRDALTYGIDVSGIMKTLYGDYANIGTKGMIRTDMPYAVAGLDYAYDVAKANELLDKAGYDKKDANGIRLDKSGNPCAFDILVYSGSTLRIRAAELTAEQLKSVGIAMTVKAMEMDTVDAYVWPEFEVSKGRDYDFAMWGWGSSIDPVYLVNMFSSDVAVGTFNVCGYVNKEVDKVITEKYNKAVTEEELYSALGEIQKLVATDPGLICFGFADVLQACNTEKYSGFKSGKGANVVNVYSFLGME